MCQIEGCDRPINRDGLCFPHKIKTIRVGTESLKREREGRDASGGQGARAYAENMYKRRRAAGLPDPIPHNKESARYAPRKGPMNGGYI